MGLFLNKKVKPGDWPRKVPASFFNKVDDVLSNLEVFNGHVEKFSDKFIIVPEANGTASPALDGFYFIFADGTESYLSLDDAISGYADDTTWSLEFDVTSSEFDAFSSGTNPVGTTSTQIHDGDASASPAVSQSYYRIPMRRNSGWVCRGGVFRENLRCDGDKGVIVEWISIG